MKSRKLLAILCLAALALVAAPTTLPAQQGAVDLEPIELGAGWFDRLTELVQRLASMLESSFSIQEGATTGPDG